MPLPFAGVPVLNLTGWQERLPKSLKGLFANYAGSEVHGLEAWDVSAVTNMNELFYGATAFNQNIGGWDVRLVRAMVGMFALASSFDQPISGWKLDSMMNMDSMFQDAKNFNQPIAEWNVSTVWTMEGMFRRASAFDQDLACWEVGRSQPTVITGIFEGAVRFSSNLNGWRVASDDDDDGNTDTSFEGSNIPADCMPGGTSCSLPGCGETCRGNQCATACQFYLATADCRALEAPDCSKVQDLNVSALGASGFICLRDGLPPQYPFLGVTSLNLTAWGNRLPISLAGLFAGYSGSGVIGIEGWEVQGVTNMSMMFWEASSYDQNLSCWEVGPNTTIDRMFQSAGSFSSNLQAWEPKSAIAAFNGSGMDRSCWPGETGPCHEPACGEASTTTSTITRSPLPDAPESSSEGPSGPVVIGVLLSILTVLSVVVVLLIRLIDP